jgi:putative heme-binding domain-containing protein
MLYNPGTAWGPEWKNHFFVAEFVGNPAQSGIHAFTLKPKGATFELGESKKVLGGVLATGMDWGPDGAMYVADWIDGWGTKDHGRVWKLDVDQPDTVTRNQVKSILAADFSKYDNDLLGTLLKHADMRVRQKSQFELATRGEDGLDVFKANISKKDHQLARVHSIWGISQLAQKNSEHGMLLIPLLKDTDPEIRAQAARWIGEVRYAAAGEQLIPVLKDDYSRARFFAAEALGRIAYEKATAALVSLLENNNDEDAYIRHAASLALARIAKPAPLVALSNHPSKAVRIGGVLALRRMKDPGIQSFLNDREEYVVTEAARGINDDLSIVPALPALGNVLRKTTFNNEALLRRAINANLRVGTDEAMQNLIDYAGREDAPATMRAEALTALGTWSKPSVVDRVDGRYRGEIKHDDRIVKAKAAPALLKLSSNKNVTVRLAAVKASGKIKIESSGESLLAILKNDKDARVREEALKALAWISFPKIGEAIQTALSDKEKNVRVAALDLLPKMKISKDLMVSLLTQVINTKTVEEKQAALLTLGTLPAENTKPVFEKLLVQLEQKKLPSEIQLELTEALDSVGDAGLKRQLKSIITKTSADTLTAAYASALWGGNIERGEQIFYQHQTAQCIRCHSLGDYGGNAGPRLNGVAKRLSREQLLQAMIDPSARLAPGYGMVTLELNNKKNVSGILQEETSTTLRLKFGDKPDTIIQKTAVRNRKNAMSSMPPMRLLLNKKEIRDVVSFIATLKDE